MKKRRVKKKTLQERGERKMTASNVIFQNEKLVYGPQTERPFQISHWLLSSHKFIEIILYPYFQHHTHGTNIMGYN